MTKPRHLLRNYLEKRKKTLSQDLEKTLGMDDYENATAAILARLDELERVIRLCEERGRF
jgi:hypothetical protein